jgi:hypothetical protein
MFPVFERAKEFHALDRAATVIGAHNMICFHFENLLSSWMWSVVRQMFPDVSEE